MGDFRILFDVNQDVIVIQRIKNRMTKAVLVNVDVEIKSRRRQVAQMQEALKDVEDSRDVLEARRRALGKKTFTQAGMEARYAVK